MEPAEPPEGEQGFGLHLAFDTDHPEFTRGFEAGYLYGLLQFEQKVEGYLHPANAEMAMRIAEAEDCEFEASDIGYDWLWVTFTRGPKAAAG